VGLSKGQMSTKCFFHTVSAGRGNLGYRNKPIRIGALTESWGPTPGVVGLRDGLVELGYRENHDFVIGVRFTQGDIAALPPSLRENSCSRESIFSSPPHPRRRRPPMWQQTGSLLCSTAREIPSPWG
jgi:hypothetical protein